MSISTEHAGDVVVRFNDAFNRHDVDQIMGLMTEDCVFEGTGPPDGERLVGHRAVRSFWERFFSSSPDARFDFEEIFSCDDRAVVRWVYRWSTIEGEPGHVRGIDVFRIREAKVAEKLSYVKG
jgi:ketosteroid isomerase-like protein